MSPCQATSDPGPGSSHPGKKSPRAEWSRRQRNAGEKERDRETIALFCRPPSCSRAAKGGDRNKELETIPRRRFRSLANYPRPSGSKRPVSSPDLVTFRTSPSNSLPSVYTSTARRTRGDREREFLPRDFNSTLSYKILIGYRMTEAW